MTDPKIDSKFCDYDQIKLDISLKDQRKNISPKLRRLHRRKTSIVGQSKAMEGIITKITETKISESDKHKRRLTTSKSASDTEGAFILPTSSARKHRRKKVRSVETGMKDLTIDSPTKRRNRSRKHYNKDSSSRNERESSISLSENSDGDTGREGDDELTDCCSGPETNIPEMIKWWEMKDERTTEEDDEFQTIMRTCLPYMRKSSRNILAVKQQQQATIPNGSFRSRMSRLTNTNLRPNRRGRRRPKSNQQQNNSGGVASSSSRNYHNEVASSNHHHHRESRNPFKRRKVTSDNDVTMVVSNEPIPSSNIGYQMLTDMGWTPGGGLTEQGIAEPVMTKGRRKRSAGLGFHKAV